MVRSLIVILLAIICGVAAAFGVSRMAANRAPATAKTTRIYVAAQPIRRGAMVTEEVVKSVDWPTGLVPPGVVTDKSEIVGRSALSSIVQDEPFFRKRLSSSEGNEFASNNIPKGMRAVAIQTSGPAASVAGFVRPGDHVDVLLTLRGNTNDETGGGSTITLLQAVEILAIDDILDVDAATVKMWMKEGLTSVTLLVSPDQAVLLSLGQSAGGSLSLALRNGDDTDESDAMPATLRQIRALQSLQPVDLPGGLAANGAAGANGAGAGDTRANGGPVVPLLQRGVKEPPPPPTYIRTLRGSQPGQIRVVGVHEASR